MGNSSSTQRQGNSPPKIGDQEKHAQSKISGAKAESSYQFVTKGKRVRSLDLPDLSALQSKSPAQNASKPIAIGQGQPNGRHAHDEVFIQRDHMPIDFADRKYNEPNQYFRGAAKSQKKSASTRGRKPPREQRETVPEMFTSSSPQPDRPGPPPPSRDNSPLPISPRQESPKPYPKLIVNSLLAPPIRIDRPNEVRAVPVKICWNGGGNVVKVARAGDDEWSGRQLLIRESPTSQTHSITIPLLPGTHHLRFLVDDQWRVADDLPTAVDDSGSLANYVGVGLDGFVITATPIVPSLSPATPQNIVRFSTPPSTSSTAPQTPRPHPGQSFWSNPNSNGDHDEPEESYQPQVKPGPTKPFGHWISEIPAELEKAARQEEGYLQATSGHAHQPVVQRERGRDRQHRNQTTQVINGFIPLPQIPDAPNLPRHLDRLILNARTTGNSSTTAGASTVVGAATGGRSTARDRDRDRERDREGRKVGSRRDRGERDRRSLTANTYSPILPRHGGESARDSDGAGPSTPSDSPTHSPVIQASNPTAPVDQTVVADDNSVLPVPSHAVLHHLSTSAIRNGVLAVGATVRYKEKYLTTIYYKPTDMN